MPFDGLLTGAPAEIINETTAHRRRAAERLRTKGWCQGTLVDEQDHACLLGALMLTARSASPYPRMTYPVLEAIEAMGFDSINAAVLWNNTCGRTRDDVIVRLEEAPHAA